MRRFWLTTTFTLIAASAQADIDCEVVNALTRIHEAGEAGQVLSTNGLPTSALRSDLSRFDQHNVARQFEQILDSEANEILTEFAAVTAQIAIMARTNQGPQISRLLQSPNVRQTFDQAGKILDRIGCVGPSAATTSTVDPIVKASDVTEIPDRPKDISQRPSIGVFEVAVWTIVAIVLLVSAGGLIIAVRHSRDKHQRRRRRYATNQEIQFKIGDRTMTGRMLDISCHGLKLKHFLHKAPTQKDQLQVRLAGRWRDVHCQWSNEHYAGLAFASRMRTATVFYVLGKTEILSTEEAEETPVTQTAP